MTLKKKGGKSPPFFSHEFIITNHGDIVSCGCMVIMIGLMFQATQGVAQLFIAAQHNVTRITNETESTEKINVNYTNGPKDLCGLFFYSLCWIVVQAIIQEYILDKFVKKLHMSKTKSSKFNDSGNMLPFLLASVVWGGNLISKENLLPKITELWEGYPHVEMTIMLKFFFILQIAYWIHMFPELYFMKAKKEEIFPKVNMYSLYLIFIAAAYVSNFTRTALCLLVIHYIPEMVFHASRIFHCAGRTEFAQNGFFLWSLLFVLARLVSTSLAILTFWFGLSKNENQGLDIPSGNFNNQTIRLGALFAVVLLQAWMAWNFIMFQVRRYRERAAQFAAARKAKHDNKKRGKKEKKTKEGKEEDNLVQNGSPNLRAKQD